MRLLGLAFVTRPQEAVFALFPAALLLTAKRPLPERLRAALRLALWALAGAAVFLALQATHSAILFSRERFALVGADGYLDFLNSRWADTLWSSWHGFLSWTPVAYAAVVGTAAYATRQWRWALPTLAIVFVMAWVNGSTADWAAGWSFGGRRFTSCLVLLAPGLAFLIDRALQRPMIVISALAVVAIGWNQLLLAQYRQNLLPSGQPVSFAQIVRQQAALATRPPFVYPFAFPANAWFAWRTGLPIDRYDLLAPEALATDARTCRSMRPPTGFCSTDGGRERPIRKASCDGSNRNGPSSSCRSTFRRATLASKCWRGRDYWILRSPSPWRCWSTARRLDDSRRRPPALLGRRSSCQPAPDSGVAASIASCSRRLTRTVRHPWASTD